MNAELLIMFTLDCDRAYLYAHPERELTPDETQRYEEALARRATGVPAQYITGHQEFWGLDLILSPAVHAQHHRGDFSHGYCVTTGWLNPALDALRVLPRCERVLRGLARGARRVPPPLPS